MYKDLSSSNVQLFQLLLNAFSHSRTGSWNICIPLYVSTLGLVYQASPSLTLRKSERGSSCYCKYRSLAKKGPWAEHLTSLPKRGVGTLSTVSAFNHERAPMSCLQRLEALEANNWAQNIVQQNRQWLRSRVLTAHNTLHCTM